MRIDMDKAESKKMWDKYHNLRDKADQALAKLSDFAGELGYGHLADGFDNDMYENYSILEDVLEEKFGSDPEYDEDDYEDEDDDFSEGDEDKDDEDL